MLCTLSLKREPTVFSRNKDLGNIGVKLMLARRQEVACEDLTLQQGVALAHGGTLLSSVQMNNLVNRF